MQNEDHHKERNPIMKLKGAGREVHLVLLSYCFALTYQSAPGRRERHPPGIRNQPTTIA
jgi:hypothetical protein